MVRERSQISRFAFDTHAFVKRLTQAGMDEQQAEALVECQVQLINDSLATKQDTEEVKRDIEALRLETKKEKARFQFWIGMVHLLLAFTMPMYSSLSGLSSFGKPPLVLVLVSLRNWRCTASMEFVV